MIEPATGEILCLVTSPSYDPNLLVGRQLGENYRLLERSPQQPLFDRSIMGSYSPGSTFKPVQALVFLQEEVITKEKTYACYSGYPYLGGSPKCHPHGSPLSLVSSLATSCNSYFCWGLNAMLNNKKYGSIQNAMNKWRDLMIDQGFGRALRVDLPSEKKGNIPSGQSYDIQYKQKWNALKVISIAIGQGEVDATPLQMCNFAATVANRGYFYTPHIVKKIKDTQIDTIYSKRRYTGIKPEYYETVIEGMRWAVVGSGGTSWKANIPNIEVCGKTGTVQNRFNDHSMFIAFAPRNNPKVAISIVVEYGGFGSNYAVPIGRLMIEKYLNGSIAESARWMEENMKNSTILRNALPKK
jgi:penicillin-binding protein 2